MKIVAAHKATQEGMPPARMCWRRTLRAVEEKKSAAGGVSWFWYVIRLRICVSRWRAFERGVDVYLVKAGIVR